VFSPPGPDSAEDSADMARSIRPLLGFLGPSALCCNLVNILRRGAPPFSHSMALKEAFKVGGNSNSHHLTSSEWRPVRASPMTLRQDSPAFNHQTITQCPAWTPLMSRVNVDGPSRPRTANTLQWNLLSMDMAQIEPTLKPYYTYLPPLNSRRLQHSPLNNLAEVQAWMT